jgi:hypothetical protein
MIASLVYSAFQTGYLSVESEGLIRQVVNSNSCNRTDLEALQCLYEALKSGQIRREAQASFQLPSFR